MDGNKEVMARHVLSDYQSANKKEMDMYYNLRIGVVWLKPRIGHIKVNCDASWQRGSGKVGMGIVARNYNGDVLSSGARSEFYASSPLEAEAKSLLWEMTHTQSRGYLEVIFELDSLYHVNALQSGSTLLQIASLVSKISHKSMSFNLCNRSFVKRNGNMVAHSIASLATNLNDESVLESRVPDCASTWVTKDVLSYHVE